VIAAEDKGVSLTIDFKRVTFELSPQQFQSLVEDAANVMKQRVLTCFEAQKTTKAALVGGVDPLETKGVSVSVSVSF
jgi:hypothetical protein